MEYYAIQSYNMTRIYGNWVATDKEKLIEAVREDLENEVLLEPVSISIDEEGFLIINNDNEDRFLKLVTLTKI